MQRWSDIPAEIWERARTMRRQPTAGEKLVWQRIRNEELGVKFRRQHPLGPFIVDFYCHDAGLVVEIDGDSHGETEQAQYDRVRDHYLENLGLRVKRYPERDVKSNIESVLSDIKMSLPPLHPPAGRGKLASPPVHGGTKRGSPKHTGTKRE